MPHNKPINRLPDNGLALVGNHLRGTQMIIVAVIKAGGQGRGGVQPHQLDGIAHQIAGFGARVADFNSFSSDLKYLEKVDHADPELETGTE